MIYSRRKIVLVCLVSALLIISFVVYFKVSSNLTTKLNTNVLLETIFSNPNIKDVTKDNSAGNTTVLTPVIDESCKNPVTDFDKNRCTLDKSLESNVSGCSSDTSCIDKAMYNSAVMTNSADYCRNIKSLDLRNKCTKETDMTSDSDKDGITDYNEVHLYFTNPHNIDTDSDGHSDYEEVNKGYNPCGSGELPQVSGLMKDCAMYKK